MSAWSVSRFAVVLLERGTVCSCASEVARQEDVVDVAFLFHCLT